MMDFALRYGVTLLLLAPLVGCEPARPEATAELPTCRLVQLASSLPDEVKEASGAAVSRAYPGTVWIHNDSGGEPVLYAVGAAGELQGQVRVAGAANVDWEDLAIADCGAGECLYIGDIGDNAGRRDQVTVYRIPEPARDDATTGRAEAFAMRFPGGPRDAEALFVLPPEQLYVVSKGGGAAVELFRYPGELRSDEVVELELVRRLSDTTVPLADRVTGADASEDGRWIVIRTYTSVLLYRADELLGSGGATPVRVGLSGVGEAGGEGVAFGPDGTIVLVAEGVESELPGTIAVLWCALGADEG